MERIAIFPGSFDPFTVGHDNIVRRGLNLFDTIIIAVGHNSTKHYLFPVAKRVEFIRELFADEPRVVVEAYSDLTVDFAKRMNASNILRGLRTAADFEYERAIAQVNKAMTNIDSVFLLTTPEHTPVNSSIVRDILKHNGDASKFIPEKIYKLIKESLNQNT
ncbi:pantetheine-phosphate adenylyltransferase [Xiashengella succiniciproducens]|jgi:pantetheine-phosphate adenylyltransferase|uniref:Phosphopantetheine adenylyltransferase n=1 Tax=Xiashengella succiniciproducens TaxID=2949635 RepID=A0A9J6ZR47_9BACT|nr:pantetheine-phosphate adenylyltransferase [Alkaliflexus sp. Ai-910]URW80103.1 pantetheine-phosphate adenylyltransferase [Alkaliflexus sp. Ai-910]HHU00584.1 pantetheine-phosphate adenylyltransferase [Bacteroidales bacterium]